MGVDLSHFVIIESKYRHNGFTERRGVGPLLLSLLLSLDIFFSWHESLLGPHKLQLHIKSTDFPPCEQLDGIRTQGFARFRTGAPAPSIVKMTNYQVF